jgi:signal peptidase II
MLFYLGALLVFAIDQILKHLIHKFMFLGQTIPLVNDVVKLTYVRNTGAAFSLFVGFSSYLAIVGLVVTAAVVYFHYRVPAKNLLIQAGLACLLGGSIGNLADRLVRSYVIDYIDITIWPVFNFADIMINVGVIMLAFNFFEKDNKDVSDPA